MRPAVPSQCLRGDDHQCHQSESCLRLWSRSYLLHSALNPQRFVLFQLRARSSIVEIRIVAWASLLMKMPVPRGRVPNALIISTIDARFGMRCTICLAISPVRSIRLKIILVAVFEYATGEKSSGCCDANMTPTPNLRPSRSRRSNRRVLTQRKAMSLVKNDKATQRRGSNALKISEQIPQQEFGNDLFEAAL
jgi:hypothetical protein